MQTGAEDPNKIKKLVETPGMMERWNELYSDSLTNLQEMGLLSVLSSGDPRGNEAANSLDMNLIDRSIRKQLVKNLPLRLRQHSDLIVGNDNVASA